MGGWNPAQFAEKRLPTLAELDAGDLRSSCAFLPGIHRARPRPTRGAGRSLPARASWSAIPARSARMRRRMAALNALRAVQTFEDRSAEPRTRWRIRLASASPPTRTWAPSTCLEHPIFRARSKRTRWRAPNQFRMYDASVALHRERQDDDAPPHLLPDDGHAARDGRACRTAAQRVSTASATT